MLVPKSMCREGDMVKKLELNIEGMSCPHCVQAVRSTLEGLPGVESVLVELSDKKATLDVDDDFDVALAVTAVEETGFSVV
ncbi:MAG: heavy-metal-associated domain-containing protein [Proteobacteria bacterium]|nr:heavy-metal-associated domain-containing protein [Pseudomonadota bacterium]